MIQLEERATALYNLVEDTEKKESPPLTEFGEEIRRNNLLITRNNKYIQDIDNELNLYKKISNLKYYL